MIYFVRVYLRILIFIKYIILFRTTTGANRSLPDIPKDKNKEHDDMMDSIPQDIYETTETMGDHSELYATVQDAGNIAFRLVRREK